MDGNIVELIRQFLQSGMGQTAILALLGVLGVRNKEAIMAIISSIRDPKPRPDDRVTPIPGPGPDDDRPRRYVIVDAHHTLFEIAAEEGHVECQRNLDEILAHLLTGKGSKHEHAE